MNATSYENVVHIYKDSIPMRGSRWWCEVTWDRKWSGSTFEDGGPYVTKTYQLTSGEWIVESLCSECVQARAKR
jgi:hypothetical protein